MKKHNLVKYEINGMNLARLINFLGENGLVIYNIERIKTEKAFFEIEKNQKKILLKYVDENKFTLIEIRKSSVENIKQFVFRNLFLLASLTACLCSFFALKFFVLQTHINGASESVKSQIQIILEDNKVETFTLKTQINVKHIENEIKNNIPKISLVSVNFKGLTLVINVKEKDEQAGIVTKENIVATHAGTVAKVNLVSGTLLVKQGDIVEEGQVLIMGEAVVNGEVTKVNPIGEVEILAFYTSSKVYDENQKTLVRTGRKTTKKYWTIFNNKVKLKADERELSTYALYETETRVVSSSLFPIVPVKSYEQIFYEQEIKTEFKSLEDNKETLAAEIIEQAKRESGFEGEFIASSFESIKLNENIYLLKGHVQFIVTCD